MATESLLLLSVVAGSLSSSMLADSALERLKSPAAARLTNAVASFSLALPREVQTLAQTIVFDRKRIAELKFASTRDEKARAEVTALTQARESAIASLERIVSGQLAKNAELREFQVSFKAQEASVTVCGAAVPAPIKICAELNLRRMKAIAKVMATASNRPDEVIALDAPIGGSLFEKSLQNFRQQLEAGFEAWQPPVLPVEPACDGGVEPRHAPVPASPWSRLSTNTQDEFSFVLAPMKDDRDKRYLVDAFNAWQLAAPGREGVCFGQYYFDLLLDADRRQQLLNIHAKLKAAGLWASVRALRHVASDSGIVFQTTGPWTGLRDQLLAGEYSRAWLAAKNAEDGVRSKKQGPELHFKFHAEGEVSVHIDLNNPGEESLIAAFEHWKKDELERDQTHSPAAIQERLHDSGIEVPLLAK